jgi:hypothetical protein
MCSFVSQAVHDAHEGADEERREEDDGPGRLRLGEDRGRHHRERQDGTHGEVDAGGHDDDELPEREQRVEVRLPEDVEDVALGEEHVRLREERQHAHDEHEQEHAPAVDP